MDSRGSHPARFCRPCVDRRHQVPNSLQGRPAGALRPLADWVERTGANSISSKPEPASPLGQALDLEQRAVELRRGPNAQDNANVVALPAALLTDAINLFDRDKLGRDRGRRETDVLIGLLLRRGDWRLASSDIGGASQDARRVLQINDKIGDAYRLLGDAAATTTERRRHYERALALDDANTEAMSGLIRLLEADDPQAALALMQIERKHKQYWSSDFARLARLELKVGHHRELLDAIEQAIARAPRNKDLYALRRAYEMNLEE